MDIKIIKMLCEKNAIRWTNHILIRLLQRGISIKDIKHGLLCGKIIEEYPNDYLHPSCLVLGMSVNRQYIHVVCGIAYDELWLITAYYPNPDEWNNDFTQRRRQQR